MTFEERIEAKIFLIRDRRVMIDVDLAELYQVTPKRLREQIRRNVSRFPDDFMFELTKSEVSELLEGAANCGTLEKLRYSNTLPRAFTEYGAIMLANILNSERAISASIEVVRTFVKIKELAFSNKELFARIEKLEHGQLNHEQKFKAMIELIKQIPKPQITTKKKIGI